MRYHVTLDIEIDPRLFDRHDRTLADREQTLENYFDEMLRDRAFIEEVEGIDAKEAA